MCEYCGNELTELDMQEHCRCYNCGCEMCMGCHDAQNGECCEGVHDPEDERTGWGGRGIVHNEERSTT